jgi:hypothetical protein
MRIRPLGLYRQSSDGPRPRFSMAAIVYHAPQVFAYLFRVIYRGLPLIDRPCLAGNLLDTPSRSMLRLPTNQACVPSVLTDLHRPRPVEYTAATATFCRMCPCFIEGLPVSWWCPCPTKGARGQALTRSSKILTRSSPSRSLRALTRFYRNVSLTVCVKSSYLLVSLRQRDLRRVPSSEVSCLLTRTTSHPLG